MYKRLSATGKYNYAVVQSYLVALIAFSMPFSIKVNTWLILLCGLHYVCDKNLLQKAKQVINDRYVQLLFLFFLAHVVSCFLSTNKTEGFAILERRGSFIIIPFLLYGHDKAVIKKTALWFVYGVIAAFLVCLINAMINYSGTHDSSVFFYQKLASAVDFNAVYMAAYCLIGIHILLYHKSLPKLLSVTGSAVLLLFCLLLNSKMMLFILFMGLVVYGFNFFSKRRALIISGLTLAGILAVGTGVPKIRERLTLEFSSNFKVLEQDTFRYDTHFTGTSLRLLFWKFSFDIQSQRHAWLTGLNTGDFQDVLNKKYIETNLYHGNPELHDTGYLGYGPHNQYIEVLFSMGIVALLLFIYILVLYFKNAIRSRNYMGMQIMLLFILFFFTESALSVNKGIVPFVFFTVLFLGERLTEPS
jgi:O-antigen ligase